MLSKDRWVNPKNCLSHCSLDLYIQETQSFTCMNCCRRKITIFQHTCKLERLTWKTFVINDSLKSHWNDGLNRSVCHSRLSMQIVNFSALSAEQSFESFLLGKYLSTVDEVELLKVTWVRALKPERSFRNWSSQYLKVDSGLYFSQSSNNDGTSWLTELSETTASEDLFIHKVCFFSVMIFCSTKTEVNVTSIKLWLNFEKTKMKIPYHRCSL